MSIFQYQEICSTLFVALLIIWQMIMVWIHEYISMCNEDCRFASEVTVCNHLINKFL